MYGLACSSTLSNCIAVGDYFTNTPSNNLYQPVAYTYNGSTWSAPIQLASVSDTSFDKNQLVSIACDSSGMICTAVGQADSSSVAENLLYTTQNGGLTWSGPVILSGISGSDNNVFNSVACSSSGTICTAVGRGDFSSGSVSFSYASTNSGLTWTGPSILPIPAGYTSSD